jgi:hypothetical protein
MVKNDTFGNCDIISWDTNRIVVDVPILPAQYKSTFSLKLKVWRSHDKYGKLPVSRTKSRACINAAFADSLLNGKCTDRKMRNEIVKYRRNILGITNNVSPNTNTINSTFENHPLAVNDIVSPTASVENPDLEDYGKIVCGVVKQVQGNGRYLIHVIYREDCGEFNLYPRFSGDIVFQASDRFGPSHPSYGLRQKLTPVSNTNSATNYLTTHFFENSWW